MVEATVTVQELKVILNNDTTTLNRIVSIDSPGFLKVLPIIKAVKTVSSGKYRVVNIKVKRIPAKYLFNEGELVAMMR